MKISAKKHELRLTELLLFVTIETISTGKLRKPRFARKQLPGSRHSASAAATPRGRSRSDRIVEEERWMYQSKMKSEETDHLFKAILSLKTEEECYRFFDDLCTFSEIEAMSQRFEVASLLADGKTFTQISQKIGVSSTTITRVNKCLCYGADGYKLLLERAKEEK
jgi:TrpR-related protein YerC/YecD